MAHWVMASSDYPALPAMYVHNHLNERTMKDSSECPFTADPAFTQGDGPTCEQTLGAIVMDLLRAGEKVSKSTLCLAVVSRIETADNSDTHAHLLNVLELIIRSGAC